MTVRLYVARMMVVGDLPPRFYVARMVATGGEPIENGPDGVRRVFGIPSASVRRFMGIPWTDIRRLSPPGGTP